MRDLDLFSSGILIAIIIFFVGTGGLTQCYFQNKKEIICIEKTGNKKCEVTK